MKKPLIRASEAYKLLTQPRTIKAREAGELSETTKTFIKELWLREEYNYDAPVSTPQMLKGLLCEQDSFDLVTRQIPVDEFRVKNEEWFKDDMFSGTPDCILKSGVVEDIKTSWTLKTFLDSELEKSYYTQLQVYMHLTGCKKARLIYCLVDTPEEIVRDQTMKFFWKYGADEDNPHYQEAERKIYHMHKVSDKILENKRVKYFEFDYDVDHIELLKGEVEKAWKFYNTLEL